MKGEVDVLGSPGVPNSLYGFSGCKATLNQSSGAVSVKVEVDVLGSPSLTVCTVSVDVNQHQLELEQNTVSELRSCVNESRSGRPGLPRP